MILRTNPIRYLSKQLELHYEQLNFTIISTAVFLSCFLLSFVAGSFMIQPRGTEAATGLTLVGAATMTLSTSSNVVDISITPTSTGTLASGSHTITAATNVPTGYNLALSAPAAPAFAPASGTFASPTVLADNTWGYAVPGLGGFDASYTTPTPSATSRWANPTTTATIKNTSSAAANDSTAIYYGAKINTSQPSGVYANTVRYTATANLADIPTPIINGIAPSSGTTAGGTAIIITGTGFTTNDQSVTTAVTIDGQACTNVSISSNVPVIGQDAIYCNTPTHPLAGAVDVVVTTWGGTATKADGYTYIAPANVTFVSPNIASTIAGTESGAAFTIVGTGFTGATNVTIGGTACTTFEVISNTQIFCESPNTINTTGAKAIVVTKGNTVSTGTVNVTYNNTVYPTLQATNAFTQCTTTARIFRDERDSQLYYVKRMVDGKCWMVDNLKYANYGTLSQEAGKYLTVDGTATESAANWNVAKYIDPGATSYCTGNTNLPTNTNTRCGLLYNWYAATRGTGTYAVSVGGTQAPSSICPANFRLPSGSSGAGGPTTTGLVYTAADFPVLNASMAAGSVQQGNPNNDATTAAGWQPSGAWGGAFSGGWVGGPSAQGSEGYYWSSTAFSAPLARSLIFGSGNVSAGYNDAGKIGGFAVRCVMEQPPAQKTSDDIQTVTTASCPTTMTMVNDARDDATYWIQKLADGRCWMLTNLAYGGGGTNTYGDVKSIANGEAAGTTYTTPYYYVPSGSNRTTGTTDPSTSTGGTGQYGYLYNWCAAMGAQTSTSACANTTTPAPNTSISICPSGWRLPAGGSGGEFEAMTTAIGATNNAAGSTVLRSTWLGMYSGHWNNGFYDQGSHGYFWSASQGNATSAYSLYFNSSGVYPSGSNGKNDGFAVRCIAN